MLKDEEQQNDALTEEGFDILNYTLTKRDKKNEKKYIPAEIEQEEPIFSVNFHPQKDLIALGSVDGTTSIWEYHADANKLIGTFQQHEESCREVCFSDDGKYLLSVSADKSVAAVDVEKNKTKWQVTNAHKHPLNTFIVCDENLIATGDDEGYIKVWDLRQRKCAASFEENGDYITDFDYHDGKDILYATSGDGCMSVFSLRKGAVIEVTNQSKQDFLSVRNMHRGEKVVVGTGKGNLLVFKDDNWEHYNAKFATGLSSVDCLLFATEELVVAGSADGYIRSYKIGKPKIKMVHQIASEQDAINQISLARDGKYIASCGDDNVVKFWNSAMLFGMDLSNEIEKEEEQEEKNENNKRPAVTEAKQQPQTKKRKPQNSARKEFFSELLGSYKDVKK